MSKPSVYYVHASPPSRFVIITARDIGLDIDLKLVDLSVGEQFKPDYKSINPTATVPLLDDNGTKIIESCAIAMYLVDKYAKDDSLYPKDFMKRTKVNERLFYLSSYIFPCGYQILFPVFFGTETEIAKKKIEELWRGYETIESFLTESKFLAGDTMTLADIYLWCLMESAVQLIPIEQDKYPNFYQWLEDIRKHPQYQFNKEGADKHIGFFRMCLGRNMAAKQKAEEGQ